jgi:glycerophosphoryl diester phosphodiesterase
MATDVTMQETVPTRYGLWLARIFWPLLLFEIAMAVAMVFLLDPLVVALLQALVALSGDPYAGNAALMAYFLSPVGLLTVVTAGVTFVLLAALNFGGVSLIAWNGMHGHRPNLSSVWIRLSQRLPALLAITVIVFVVLALLAAVVIGTAFVAHAHWLSDADIYFHLTTRSTEFVLAVVVVAVTAVCTAGAAFWWGLRWFLSVPICVLRSVPAIAALRMSAQATRGRRRALSLSLIAWLAGTLALSAIAAIVLAGLYDLWLSPEQSLGELHRNTVVLVLISFGVSAAESCLSGAALALIAIRLYAQQPGSSRPDHARSAILTRGSAWRIALALSLGISLASVAVVQAVWSIDEFSVERPVAVTAHRAGSLRAPENTLAALQRAIAEGADYVEIDAQETLDGELVVLHDTDLRRVAGLPRSIWEVRYEDIEHRDVGSWFDPGFRGERIPTLRAFARAAKGRIGINIELKVSGHEVDLARRVIAILRQLDMLDEVVLSSLDANILHQVRQIDPSIRVGLIVTTGIGRLAAVDVDFFAISGRLATPGLIRRLADSGRKVHVWGLYDADDMVTAILDGADNIIVNDPELAIETRRWVYELSAPEQSLWRLRDALERGELIARPVLRLFR